MNRKTSLSLLAGLAVTFSAVTLGQSQVVERGSFDVVIAGGAMLHPNASAIVDRSPVLTLQSQLFVTDNIGIGFILDYTRTETDDDIFALAQFAFFTADSTTLVALTQAISVFQWEAIGTFGVSMGEKLYPYLLAGVGGYTIYVDPQQNNAASRESNLMFSIGGVLKYKLGSSSSLELAVRDAVWTDFDRNTLNPLPDRTCRQSGVNQFSGTVCPNERFPNLDPELSDPNWSEPSSTVHNIIISAAFAFFPGI